MSGDFGQQKYHLGLLNSRAGFWEYYNQTKEILLNCRHSNYVTKSDKKELAEDIECPLDRQHMKYLLLMDPILVMFQKQKDVKIFITPFF